MITVKIILAFLVVKLSNVSAPIKLLHTLYLESPHPPPPIFLSSGYSLDLTMSSFIFLARVYETFGGSEKSF